MSFGIGLRSEIEYFFKEDDLGRNMFYFEKLPKIEVKCQLKIKSDLRLAGLSYFIESFKYLGAKEEAFEQILNFEGNDFKEGEILEFSLPFHIALTGERIALNLLQKCSSIATFTKFFVDKAEGSSIKVLDTRKTTPGLRNLEKYGVRIGGGLNHRFGQTDVWMVKDNHKTFFGGVEKAVKYFHGIGDFYRPIIVEAHNLDELKECLDLGVKHVMLDNFSPEKIREAVKLKIDPITYEISGGINLGSISDYLIEGVDAISIGALTYGAPPVDLSLKYERE